MSRKILLVEDDAATALYLQKGLSEAGYGVETCADGRDGLFLASEGIFDLIIADRMLPGLDGAAMTAAIRAAGITTPILILSALASIDNRVDGLGAGADDYLCKPFSFAELSARVQALLRRGAREVAEPQTTRIAVGDLEIDLLGRQVSRAGRAILLGAREYTLLEYLARHAGQVVTRTMMLEKIWNYHFDPGSNVVDVHIGRLRRKLEEGFATPILHTVRGAGYRLAGRLMQLSVTARIALLSVALAILSNLAVLGVVRQQTRTDALAELRRETVADVDSLTAAWRSGGETAVRATVDDAADPTDDDAALGLFDARGSRLAGTGPDRLAVPLAATRFRTARLAADGDWSDDDAGYSLHATGRLWVLGARRLTIVEDQQRGLERALLVGVVIALGLGALGGLIVSRYVARRLDRIAGVIDAAGEGDLSRRVARTAGGDAFDRLGGRLNATLDRIERLMTELRVVTDGLAHDLRSPLARLRSRTEQAVLLPDGAARDAALGGLLVETDQVMRMLTMLIEISKAEQVARSRFAPADLGDLLSEIADLYGPLLDDAQVAFTLDVEPALLPIAVHRELLSQAVTNLLDNALKYGEGAAIVVTLRDEGAMVAVEVADRGPGIAASDHADAVRRFGRLDAARTTPGAGLGMALVAAVARLHGGRLVLEDNAPGLIARIILPRDEARA